MLALAAIAGGSQAAGAYASSRNNKKAADRQAAVSEDQIAVEESRLNPFRGAGFQSTALQGLDRQQNTTPRAITQSGGPGGYGEIQGGQYTMSPELTRWLAELKSRIANGSAANPAITPGYRAHQPNLNLSNSPLGVPQNPMTSAPVGLGGMHYDPNTRQWVPDGVQG